MAQAFSQLSGREILALPISLEEDDARIYGDRAERLKAHYPDTAKLLKTHAGRRTTACPKTRG